MTTMLASQSLPGFSIDLKKNSDATSVTQAPYDSATPAVLLLNNNISNKDMTLKTMGNHNKLATGNNQIMARKPA